MSTSDERGDGLIDPELDAVENHLQRLEERLNAVEERISGAAAGQSDADGGVGELWVAVNELRHEHNALREAIEEGILGYLREDVSLLRSVKEQLHHYGEIMRLVEQNKRRVSGVEAALNEKIGYSDFTAFEEDEQSTHRQLQEQVKQLQAQLNHIADQIED